VTSKEWRSSAGTVRQWVEGLQREHVRLRREVSYLTERAIQAKYSGPDVPDAPVVNWPATNFLLSAGVAQLQWGLPRDRLGGASSPRGGPGRLHRVSPELPLALAGERSAAPHIDELIGRERLEGCGGAERCVLLVGEAHPEQGHVRIHRERVADALLYGEVRQ
jgi:hypothetical protein